MKKRAMIIALILTAAVALVACNQSAQVETPFADTTQATESAVMTETEAAAASTEPVTVATEDSTQLPSEETAETEPVEDAPPITKIEVYQDHVGAIILHNTISFTYDSNDNLDSIDDHSALDYTTAVLDVETDPEGRIIKLDTGFYDYNRSPYMFSDYAEYEYNEKDQLISRTIFSGGGGKVEYFYNEEGQLIKEVQPIDDAGGADTKEYFYENGILTKSVSTMSAQWLDPSSETVLYTLDPFGRIIKEYNEEREYTTIYNYDYAPFTVSWRESESGPSESIIAVSTEAGDDMVSFYLRDLSVETDEKGLPIRMTGTYNLTQYILEISYGDDTDDTDNDVQETAPALDSGISEQDLIGIWNVDTDYTMDYNHTSMNDMYGRPYNDKMTIGEDGYFRYFITYYGGEGSFKLMDDLLEYDVELFEGGKESASLQMQEINGTLYLVQEYWGQYSIFWKKTE